MKKNNDNKEYDPTYEEKSLWEAAAIEEEVAMRLQQIMMPALLDLVRGSVTKNRKAWNSVLDRLNLPSEVKLSYNRSTKKIEPHNQERTPLEEIERAVLERLAKKAGVERKKQPD